jgi:hypothetical protein
VAEGECVGVAEARPGKCLAGTEAPGNCTRWCNNFLMVWREEGDRRKR